MLVTVYSCKIEHGLTSAPTQYRLYSGRFSTGQKTQPTVSRYWRRKILPLNYIPAFGYMLGCLCVV